jgi:hypothetical protein
VTRLLQSGDIDGDLRDRGDDGLLMMVSPSRESGFASRH